MPPIHFALVILEMGISLFALTVIFPFMLPTVTGMTGVSHHAQLFSTEMGSWELFAWVGLKPRSSQSLPPK
jgi:hypothetical protein